VCLQGYEVDDGLSLYFRADKWSMQNDDTVAPEILLNPISQVSVRYFVVQV
jgi:hypothetical protein